VPKPKPEELIDEEQRVTPIGLFNYAESYRTAARALRRSKSRASHKDSPIRFLYYHTIELYLKAHLRLHGIHPYELRTKFGHSAEALRKKSAEFGLEFEEEDLEVIGLMSETDAVIRSRYISTGYFRWPDIAALDRTCNSLRLSVWNDFKANKVFVRLNKAR
jgi:HEPN domain-containing protein